MTEYIAVPERFLQKPLNGLCNVYVDTYWLVDVNGDPLFFRRDKDADHPLCNRQEEMCQRLLASPAYKDKPPHACRKIPLAFVRTDYHGREKAPDTTNDTAWGCSHVAAEQTRWQEAIYELCCATVPEELQHFIDGSGCDSGDPLDVTLTEIGQMRNILQHPEDYD